ncbi:hypothetical protein PN462_16365 [Spirulina sp. CS-785/01]|uniref:hypothetical protein n=1 Tax=Spirulina sp. CS-785/01 TaxID=3021716 RepID=UPI00232EC00E|nr:hypothetical protein [Spirulina sp. CS-785/01]MDB9314688.1 hypothetical protein [Spirulina sp. CS-785/01]
MHGSEWEGEVVKPLSTPNSRFGQDRHRAIAILMSNRQRGQTPFIPQNLLSRHRLPIQRKKPRHRNFLQRRRPANRPLP